MKQYVIKLWISGSNSQNILSIKFTPTLEKAQFGAEPSLIDFSESVIYISVLDFEIDYKKENQGWLKDFNVIFDPDNREKPECEGCIRVEPKDKEDMISINMYEIRWLLWVFGYTKHFLN